MIEHILLAKKTGLIHHTSEPPIAIMTHSLLGRGNFTLGLSGTSLIMTGGYGQPANLYPSNFPRITLNAAGTGIAGAASVNGYDGSGPGSAQIGTSLYVAQGHDGAYQRYFKTRAISNGVQIATSANSPGAARTYPMVAAIDSDTLYWGGGSNASGWLRDAYKYTISSNSWTSIPQPPEEFILNARRFDGKKMSNGKLVVGRTRGEDVFIIYNPTTNSYEKTSSWGDVLEIPSADITGTVFIDAATAVVGKYALFFEQGYAANTQSILSCLRYDCENDSFDVIDFPDQAPRYGARCAIDLDKGYLYLVGGSVQSTMLTAVDKTTKHANALVYPLSQFLI